MSRQRLGHRPAYEPELCPRPNGKVKVGYRSVAKARQAIIRERGNAGVPLFAYQCWRCHLWHLTSRLPRGAS